MDLAIYGAGKCGEYVLDEIRSDKHNEIQCTLFIDNNPDYSGKSMKDIPIVNVEYFLRKKQADAVLVAVSNIFAAQEMVLSLLKGDFENIYVVPQNLLNGKFPVLDKQGGLASYIQRYDRCKPVLPYVEYHVSDLCNLNCKGCGHFSNISCTTQFPDIDNFKESLKGCSQKFEDIALFRLMGGEPFVNPDLDLYIRAVRNFFPYSVMRIVTNGLLLPYVSGKILEAIRECGVLVEITQYPVTRDILDILLETTKKWHIKTCIGKPVTKFFKQICLNKNSDYNMSWKKCASKTCHFLRNGRIYPCAIVLGFENREFLELNISEHTVNSNSFDLIGGKEDGWRILLKLTEPTELCKYCSTDVEWFDWSVSGRNVKKEDWIIEK